MELAEVLLAGAGTALATGLGAIPVFLLGPRAERLRTFLSLIAAGVMSAAAIFGLLVPALDDGGPAAVGAGAAIGVAFVVAARARLVHDTRFEGPSRARARQALLVFGVLLVHSLPEGFAVGAAWASDTAGLGVFVVVAIALQNVPEGTAVAIPLALAGYSRSRQFWAAVLSSAPQPLGAGIAFVLVEEVRAVLPVSLAFAAGAMLAVVVTEILPSMSSVVPRRTRGTAADGGQGTRA
jgi:ZIP family zinc transporter